MKKVGLYLLLLLLVCACGKERKQVVLSYPEGNPKLIYLLKGTSEKPILIGEEMFYENGKTRYKGSFDAAEETRTGVWKYYFEDGSLFASGNFSQNPQGEKWEFFKKEGGSLNETKKNIEEVELSDEGIPISCSYSDGEKEVTFFFHSSFAVRMMIESSGGETDGKSVIYHENGSESVVRFYDRGEAEGAYNAFYDNGTQWIEGTYSKGKKVGKWSFYDTDGKETHYEEYDNAGNILVPSQNGLRYYDKEGNLIAI